MKLAHQRIEDIERERERERENKKSVFAKERVIGRECERASERMCVG